MYSTFPPVDIHTTCVLYISLLCTISLVLLYKNRASYRLFEPPFLSIPYNHFSPLPSQRHSRQPLTSSLYQMQLSYIPSPAVHCRTGKPYLIFKWCYFCFQNILPLFLHSFCISHKIRSPMDSYCIFSFIFPRAATFATISSPTCVSTFLPNISTSR